MVICRPPGPPALQVGHSSLYAPYLIPPEHDIRQGNEACQSPHHEPHDSERQVSVAKPARRSEQQLFLPVKVVGVVLMSDRELEAVTFVQVCPDHTIVLSDICNRNPATG